MLQNSLERLIVQWQLAAKVATSRKMQPIFMVWNNQLQEKDLSSLENLQLKKWKPVKVSQYLTSNAWNNT